MAHPIRRVGMIFSGGPAPAANAVISAAAISFLAHGIEVIGFFRGYSHLEAYHPVTHRLLPDVHYRQLKDTDLRGIRNERGILLGTARSNPGRDIRSAEDLSDPVRNAPLTRVYNALVDLEIDALVSIGGDDTLKTANFLVEFQKRLPDGARLIRVAHLPKTIDNDYKGIDFTFGFFTAVDFMAKELQNLRADAMSTSSWFIVETMGRKAGWLAYGVAIAGEATLVLAVEDLDEALCKEGQPGVLDIQRLADRIVDQMIHRRQAGKYYGTVVLAEGLVESLPLEELAGIPRDEHGHISIGRVDLGKIVASTVSERYEQRTGKKSMPVKGVQLGYESRCAPPHAFDVMLGSQLGIGAYRALVERGLDAHMVSIAGQLDLLYVPFSQLIDPKTLLTDVRLIQRDSDFHKLARFLEERTERVFEFTPGPR